MDYIEVKIQAEPAWYDILIAELNEKGYDSFDERENELAAFIDSTFFDEALLKQLQEDYKSSFTFTYSFDALPKKNWNEEWEKNFPPVIIEDTCIIRASFHQPGRKYAYDIVINPKMSFGTGHHETTSMMIRHLLHMDLKDKLVMDAGSGTGILAIMACKLGARAVDAFDVEEWAYENCLENIRQNQCPDIYVSMGTIASVRLQHTSYDVILANINKNVLLDEISVYSQFLRDKGHLVLSGFYEQDIQDIDFVGQKYFLRRIVTDNNNNWASIIYEKSENQ